MTTIALPQISPEIELPVASAVREGLSARPKRLPSWLFYDDAGSRLFDQITELPEYYVTRTERAILTEHATEMIAQAAGLDMLGLDGNPVRLRIVELGAGSADKTRLLLKAAAERQGTLIYEPVDVSSSALETARERIERDLPAVQVLPLVADYTPGLNLDPLESDERRMVLYIGSSIGNFEPSEAEQLLQGVREGLSCGDTILLGVDMRKDEATLLAAYNDAAGVTARFNLNMLARVNRELDANFNLEAFAHRAIWNKTESRIEMHLVSSQAQRVKFPSLDFETVFRTGDHIHTENSYKYAPGQAEAMLTAAGFVPESTWMDAQGWFAVCLARVE